ncbi:MAG: hypothetical protein M1829_006812 [Trizodia sp. TS-e1964]|nr:MAG: hypothetical protein M1829_006812 [Trizodia sp. TS-e1964]
MALPSFQNDEFAANGQPASDKKAGSYNIMDELPAYPGTRFEPAYLPSFLKSWDLKPSDIPRFQHLCCSRFTQINGEAPTLNELKQHAQALLIAIIALDVRSCNYMNAMDSDIVSDPLDWIDDLKTPYNNPDPSHQVPLTSFVNTLPAIRFGMQTNSYRGGLSSCGILPPYNRYADVDALIMHANEVLEALDAMCSSHGGLMSIQPRDSPSPVGETTITPKWTDTLLGQWIAWTQGLLTRLSQIETEVLHARAVLAGPNMVPKQLKPYYGDDLNGTQLLFPQDRFVLTNVTSDHFAHLSKLLEVEEKRVAEAEKELVASPVGDYYPPRVTSELFAVDLPTRYYRHSSGPAIYIQPSMADEAGPALAFNQPLISIVSHPTDGPEAGSFQQKHHLAALRSLDKKVSEMENHKFFLVNRIAGLERELAAAARLGYRSKKDSNPFGVTTLSSADEEAVANETDAEEPEEGEIKEDDDDDEEEEEEEEEDQGGYYNEMAEDGDGSENNNHDNYETPVTPERTNPELSYEQGRSKREAYYAQLPTPTTSPFGPKTNLRSFGSRLLEQVSNLWPNSPALSPAQSEAPKVSPRPSQKTSPRPSPTSSASARVQKYTEPQKKAKKPLWSPGLPSKRGPTGPLSSLDRGVQGRYAAQPVSSPTATASTTASEEDKLDIEMGGNGFNGRTYRVDERVTEKQPALWGQAMEGWEAAGQDVGGVTVSWSSSDDGEEIIG